MTSYNTIIFDLGGVIIDLDKERCIEAFKGIGYMDVDLLLGNYKQDGEFLALEEGKLSAGEWRNFIRGKIGRDIADELIDNAFNAFLVDIPIVKLRMLRRLRDKYRIVMLSNTNPVMFEGRIRELFRCDGWEMEDYFDDIFVSYRMGMSKPSRGIFTEVADRLGIMPEEAMFIDDSVKNIAMASDLGFNTMIVDPYTDFSDKLL